MTITTTDNKTYIVSDTQITTPSGKTFTQITKAFAPTAPFIAQLRSAGRNPSDYYVCYAAEARYGAFIPAAVGKALNELREAQYTATRAENAELARKAAAYDRTNNEGGDGYNPYR